MAGLIGASCSSDTNDSTTADAPTSTSTTAISSTVPAPALVGTWTRTTTCEEYVERQTEAGFIDDIAGNIAGNGWLPGIDAAEAIPDPAQPCATAVPREHSHFFTDDGEFGSLDWQGGQVDGGTYELVDDHTLVMAYSFEDGDAIDMTFDFQIDADSITFDPQPPADCTSRHCREAASWAVAVAYSGLRWRRTE